MYFLILLIALTTTSAIKEEYRVYNGDDLDPTEQRYLVYLQILTGENGPRMKCSSSIISKHWLLTAAHCLPAKRPITIIYVRQINNEVNRTLAKVTPNNVFPHPKYIHNKTTLANTRNDIALLEASKKIVFDDYAGSIEPGKYSPRNNQSAILSGYGLNELGEFLPRQGVVKVSKCPFDDSRHLLCSKGKVKSGAGDSGGPLSSKGKLVGVTAGVGTHNCDKTDPNSLCTTVYVNVAAHYKWIKKVTGL